MDFAVPADHGIKVKECEKKDSYPDIARELKKTMEHYGNNYINSDWYFWYSHQRIIEGTGGLGAWWTSGNHSNYNITENGQNNEKNPQGVNINIQNEIRKIGIKRYKPHFKGVAVTGF